jgi:hypothetical protein
MARYVDTSIQIDATPQNVWAVLADLGRYGEWHPKFISVTGQLTVGSKLTIKTTDYSGRAMTVKVKVLTVEPDAELRWASKMLGITISKRTFLLSPSAGGTVLEQSGTYHGIGGTGRGAYRGIMRTMNRIQETFESINEAVKRQAEARQQAAHP